MKGGHGIATEKEGVEREVGNSGLKKGGRLRKIKTAGDPGGSFERSNAAQAFACREMRSNSCNEPTSLERGILLGGLSGVSGGGQ